LRAPAAPSRSDARIYRIEDADVAPPIVISQTAPSAPAELVTVVRALRKQMVLNVTIDEKGDVEKAEVRGSIHPSYDSLLLRAARNWKYRPARKDGSPVKFEKTIIVDVK